MKNSTANGMKRNARKDITRCICDFNPGIGDFICCDKCSVWQHMRCMGIHPNAVPQVYECELCNPRPLDKESAIQSQLRLQEEEATSSEEEVRPAKVNNSSSGNRKGKRSNKSSSNSIESTEEVTSGGEYGRVYKEIRDNMYSPSVRHRLEPRTEGLPSFGASPPGLARDHPRAGFSPQRIQYPAALQIAQHGTSKIVINRQPLKSGTFVTDVKGHFKPTPEFYKEIGGKSIAMKRPLNFVLEYPRLDICIDTREYGNIARFIRRSCAPNCLVRSYLQEGKLHIGIYAADAVPSGSEMTIPFDYPLESYSGSFSCLCGRAECLVVKLQDQRRRATHIRTNSTDSTHSTGHSDEEHRKPKLSREEVKMQSYMKVIEKIERDAERKRVLSENMKSPTRDVTENEEPNTPTRAAKRRRKSSGKKSRKGSGSSLTTELDPHSGEETSQPCSPSTPLAPVISGPPYTVSEPVLSRHLVKCNGYTADIHLRPLNVTPFSRHRRNFQLRAVQTPIIPVKMQKDGFIVPLHGSLLSPRVRSCTSSYKTSKKRWLENFIKDEASKSPRSPCKSGESPQKAAISPTKTVASPSPQVGCSLEQATQSLNISEPSGGEVTPPPLSTPPGIGPATVPITPPVDTTHYTPPSEPPPQLAAQQVPPPVVQQPQPSALQADYLSSSEPMEVGGLGGEGETPKMEKKKKVTLADYRKRLQSRTKAPSVSSDSETTTTTPSLCRPVFEPISPEDGEREGGKANLMMEFSRPSLSESLSDEQLHPSKVRKVESPTTNGVVRSPQLSTETFSRIKEILSQNPGNGPILKHSLYDPNSQHTLVSQLSDEVFDSRSDT